jgi:hypothetical protein
MSNLVVTGDSTNRQVALLAAVEANSNRGERYSQPHNIIGTAEEFLAWLEGKESRRPY